MPAYTPGGRPLQGCDLLLICDSYLGLDQQYSIALGSTGDGASGASGAASLPLVGDAARRARRAEQAEARRTRAAAEGQQQAGAQAPMDVDGGTYHQQQQQQQAAGIGAADSAAGPDGALPQRAPRRPRGAAAQQLAAAEPTFDCRLDGGGGA